MQRNSTIRKLRKKVAYTDGYSKAEPLLLANVGALYSLNGDYSRAIECIEQALDKGGDSADIKDRSFILHSLAIAYEHIGKFDASARRFAEALAKSRQTGIKRNLMTELHNYAGLLSTQGKLAEAIQMDRESLDLAREIGLVEHQAEIRRNIANIESLCGEFDSAFITLDTSLRTFRETADVSGQINCLVSMATILKMRGNRRGSRELYRQAADLVTRSGSRIQGHIAAIDTLLDDGHEICDVPELQSTLRRALEETRSQKLLLTVRILVALGLACELQRNYGAAAESFQKALELSRPAGIREFHVNSLWRLGRLAFRSGDHRQALMHLDEALTICGSIELPLWLGRGHGTLAEAYELEGVFADPLQQHYQGPQSTFERVSPDRAVLSLSGSQKTRSWPGG